MRSTHTPAAAAIVIAVAVGIGARAEIEGDAKASPTAAEILRVFDTFERLTGFMGVKASFCPKTSDTHRICTWIASGRLPSWRRLAPTLPTDDRINVVCELPLGAEVRGADSCSVHPRRSNRTRWRDAPSENLEGRTEEQVRSSAARYLVDRARTALELSRLMGQGPESCERDGAGRRCLWRTSAQTEGHGTLAMAIGASSRKKVRMECWLPSDGGQRRLETCKIWVGS